MDPIYLSQIAGFVDIHDTTITAEKVLTEDSMVKICQNAKFAAVRSERIFMGYFKNGDVVGLPQSPVDGYQYSRVEIQYDSTLYSTRAPGNIFTSGQATPPGIAYTQPANIYWTLQDVFDETGVVTTYVSYYKKDGAETITRDGIVKVYANCQRQSLNV